VADTSESLHDNPRSPKREKVTVREKITERDAASDGEGEKKAADGEGGDSGEKPTQAKGEEQAAAGDGGSADEGPVGEPDMKARREMFKRHAQELTDHHTLTLDSMKKMQSRHARELGSIFKQGAASGEKPKKTPLHGGDKE
jgi:hypothetical protein